jgi:Tfp pilus assembly protein PilF
LSPPSIRLSPLFERRAFTKPALAATGSAVAYQHLVLGYRYVHAGEWSDAVAAFQGAIREDATYAHAHAMLAVTIYLSAQVQPSLDGGPRGCRTERQART